MRYAHARDPEPGTGQQPLTGPRPDRRTWLAGVGGNNAMGRMFVVQRDPLPGTTPGAAPAATLPTDQQRQLLAASATLRDVQPLPADQEATLRQAIPATPLLQMIGERDTKRTELRDRTAELERMRDAQAHPPENGAPPTAEMVAPVATAVETLTAEVTRLDTMIRDGLRPLGVDTEEQLTDLVSNRFPTLFLNRGKQITLAELRHNRTIAEAELRRYGLDACVDPAARHALVAAARDLVDRDRQIDALRERLTQIRSDVDLPDGGLPDPARMSSSYHDLGPAQERLDQASREREELRKRYAVQHPILLRTSVDLTAVASGDDTRFDQAVGGQLRQVVEDIDRTRENVESGRLKVWNLTNIVELTNQDLGTAQNEILQTALRNKIQQEQADQAAVTMAVAALAITAGLIATFASGGVALAGAVAAVGVGGYQASESVRNFLAERSANNVALDPAVADLSRQEPELGWMLLDLVSVGLDAVAVVRAFQAMRVAGHALAGTGDVVEFATQARRAVPGAGADRLIVSASRRAGTGGGAGRVMLALRDSTAFRPHALVAVEKQIRKVSGDAWAKVFQRLRTQNRVHPLTHDALRAVFGEEHALQIRAANKIDADLGGLYVAVEGSPGNGHLFLENARKEAVAETAIHETTHYLQDVNQVQVDKVTHEMQAWLAQADYITRYEKLGGTLTDAQLSIVGVPPDMLADTIAVTYGVEPLRSAYDASKELEKVMQMVRAFK
nr:hypothetical protein [Kibdelosporangium sp. MJ126-NF4]CEL19825.1 hypothetical protein [Kibdelosporangium sp. MJ126-NF4]